jgi:hypothetical protein
MSSDTLKFSKQPPSEALKGGLPVSVLQLSGKFNYKTYHFKNKKAII